jgi:hypothetical protein
MISIDNTIISEDVIKVQFVCDLKTCKGDCCVQGDEGAPLEEYEISELEDALDEVIPYMRPEGIEVVDRNGVFDYGMEGDYVTALVNDNECAFVYFEKDIAYCAIEKAYLEEKIKFRKPISCHLYPIRITKYADFDAVNYHQWPVCNSALKYGKQLGIPVYKMLKEPLIRKYGENWYQTLEDEIASGIYDEVLNK